MLGLVLLAALLGVGWGLKQWLYGRSHETTDNAQVDGHLVPVLAKVSGYVTAVNVAENDRVRADSVLVRIDEREYAVRLAQADADLAAARAPAGGRGIAGQAEAQVENAAGQRAALDANIGAARANAVKAEADLARMRELAGEAGRLAAAARRGAGGGRRGARAAARARSATPARPARA